MPLRAAFFHDFREELQRTGKLDVYHDRLKEWRLADLEMQRLAELKTSEDYYEKASHALREMLGMVNSQSDDNQREYPFARQR